MCIVHWRHSPLVSLGMGRRLHHLFFVCIDIHGRQVHRRKRIDWARRMVVTRRWTVATLAGMRAWLANGLSSDFALSSRVLGRLLPRPRRSRPARVVLLPFLDQLVAQCFYDVTLIPGESSHRNDSYYGQGHWTREVHGHRFQRRDNRTSPRGGYGREYVLGFSS